MAADLLTSRQRLAEMLLEDPQLSAADAAETLQISRQRVHQLFRELGVKPAKKRRDYTRPPKVLTGGVMSQLTATMKGTVSELLVAADLLQRGYQVFAPITRHHAGIDLITLERYKGTMQRIEVKGGVRRGGKLQYQQPSHDYYDRLAIVVAGERPIYRPPFPEDEKA